MENIDSRPRITVAEAISRAAELITNHPDKNRFPDEVAIFVEVVRSPDSSEIHPPNGKTVVERIDGKEIARRNLRSAFFAFCEATKINPLNLHNPWQTDSYRGGPEIEDYRHNISADEYDRWATPFLPSKIELKAWSGADRASRADENDRWQAKAVQIADELFDRDTAGSYRDSLDGYSKRVMDAMQARGISGPRGIITNHKTIQREALQGQLWWAKKKK